MRQGASATDRIRHETGHRAEVLDSRTSYEIRGERDPFPPDSCGNRCVATRPDHVADFTGVRISPTRMAGRPSVWITPTRP
jgi:hypothetical protein